MQAPNRTFDGRLSELSIFDEALTPAQIQDLYSNVRQNFETINASVLPPKPPCVPTMRIIRRICGTCTTYLAFNSGNNARCD